MDNQEIDYILMRMADICILKYYAGFYNLFIALLTAMHNMLHVQYCILYYYYCCIAHHPQCCTETRRVSLPRHEPQLLSTDAAYVLQHVYIILVYIYCTIIYVVQYILLVNTVMYTKQQRAALTAVWYIRADYVVKL